jgi:hypothetical protein
MAMSSSELLISGLGAVALLEFLLAAAWAWVVAANIFQRVTYRLLMAVVAVWAMHVAMLMLVVRMVVVVIAVGAVDVVLLGHGITTPR